MAEYALFYIMVTNPSSWYSFLAEGFSSIGQHAEQTLMP